MIENKHHSGIEQSITFSFINISYIYSAQQELETARGLLDEATALLDDVRKGNGMNKTQMNQYERLRKALESLKKQRNVAHQSSFGKQSEEIIQQLKKQLEKVCSRFSKCCTSICNR